MVIGKIGCTCREFATFESRGEISARGRGGKQLVIAEISAEVLVAANDHRAERRIAFGMVLDLPAAVIVYARSPRGCGHFEFAARPISTRVSATLPPTSKVH
jgi:hypothetical protein